MTLSDNVAIKPYQPPEKEQFRVKVDAWQSAFLAGR
jgi:hypothetical protein